jgi:hypothetical protein
MMQDDGVHNDGSNDDGLFGAQISAFAQDTVVDYYITATDDLGAESTDPTDAPAKAYYYIVDYVPPMLYINEFMADNDNIIEDPDDPNNFEDWIELYNAGSTTIDLSGMYLTDNLTNPTKWRVPADVTIPSGGYLLFWADGDEEQGNMHTNFNLNRGGEEIGLFDTDAKRNMTIDTVTFGEQSTDISYARIYDGNEPWVFYENATPGYSNQSISIDMELTAGWSMISLPVRPYGSKLSELFPNAVVVYGFEKGIGYVRVAEEGDLEVGKGYWILLNDAQSYMLTGQPLNEYTYPVYDNGWEMIGGCSSPAQTSVNNGNIEVIYAFIKGFGYQRLHESENLEPGKGYWILLSNTIEQAELIVEGIESLNRNELY